jgi:hypothetical protein
VGLLLVIGCGTPTAPSPTVPSLTPAGQVVQQPTRGLVQAPSATNELPPSPIPTVTPTPTSTCTPTPSPTSTPTPTPTPSIAVATLAATPNPPPKRTNSPTPILPEKTPVPVPTPLPVAPSASLGAPRFVPVRSPQPDPSHPCGCPKAPAYVVGRVVDAVGSPLSGVRLVCYNDWHRYPVVFSKATGEYDFPISQAAKTWYVLVLGPADQAISPEVPVYFDAGGSCRYLLDWQRVD